MQNKKSVSNVQRKNAHLFNLFKLEDRRKKRNLRIWKKQERAGKDLN